MSLKNFTSRLADVAVFQIDKVKFFFTDAARCAQSITQQCPAQLQHPVLAGRKGSACKPRSDPGEIFRGKGPQVFRQNSDLLQLTACSGNGRARFCESAEDG